MDSKSLFDRALRVAPGGVHSPARAFKSVGGTPVFFSHASGAIVTSVEGKEYVDFCQSFGPLLLGHRDPDVGAVVRETLDRAWTFGACEPYSLELAEWITERIPWVSKLRFVSSGTEAVMSALRLARAATGRRLVLKFEGCYHGHVDSLLVQAGSGLAGRAAGSSAGVSDAVVSETLVAPLDDEGELDRVFSEHGKDIAAVIVEPLPANYGLLIQKKDFLDQVVMAARAHGSLVLFDEVISGFRVARGGMVEILGLQPDLVCYGKVIGGGFPIGCYGGRADLMEQVAPSGPVYQAGTLSANPVGVRAGLATLQKAERVGAYALLEEKTGAFCRELAFRFDSADAPFTVTRFGSIFWIHARSREPIRRVDAIPSQHGPMFARLFHDALSGGVYLPPSPHEVGFFSTAHTDPIVEKALGVLERSARTFYASR